MKRLKKGLGPCLATNGTFYQTEDHIIKFNFLFHQTSIHANENNNIYEMKVWNLIQFGMRMTLPTIQTCGSDQSEGRKEVVLVLF